MKAFLCVLFLSVATSRAADSTPTGAAQANERDMKIKDIAAKFRQFEAGSNYEWTQKVEMPDHRSDSLKGRVTPDGSTVFSSKLGSLPFEVKLADDEVFVKGPEGKKFIPVDELGLAGMVQLRPTTLRSNTPTKQLEHWLAMSTNVTEVNGHYLISLDPSSFKDEAGTASVGAQLKVWLDQKTPGYELVVTNREAGEKKTRTEIQTWADDARPR